MKYLFALFLLLSMTLGSPAQLPIDTTTSKVSYSAVVAVPGVSQAELYGKALKWIASVQGTSTEGVTRDATSGLLVTRIGTRFNVGKGLAATPCTLWHTITIQARDRKAKYEITDFQGQLFAHTPGQPSNPTKAQLALHPLDEYLDKANWQNYSKDGKPRYFAAGFLSQTPKETEPQVASLVAALRAKSDW